MRYCVEEANVPWSVPPRGLPATQLTAQNSYPIVNKVVHPPEIEATSSSDAKLIRVGWVEAEERHVTRKNGFDDLTGMVDLGASPVSSNQGGWSNMNELKLPHKLGIATRSCEACCHPPSTMLPRSPILQGAELHLFSCDLFFICRSLLHIPHRRQVVRAISERCNPCSITAKSHIRIPEIGATEEGTSQYHSWVAAAFSTESTGCVLPLGL